MGLDCTAYSHLKAVGRHTEGWCDVEDDGGDRTHHRAFVYTGFEQSMDGLPILGKLSTSGDPDGGCYEETPETEVFGFHPGSYSGYNRWRRELADQFNPYEEIKHEDGSREWTPIDMDKPFAELIWFADNEGTIGPKAAARLFVDFQENEAAYMSEHGDEDTMGGWSRERYADWTKAFELASHDGMVVFH